MSAQIDELPGAEEGKKGGGGGGGGILPLIIVVVLSTAISLGGGYVLLNNFVDKQDHGSAGAGGGKSLDEEPTGAERIYEIKELITNMSGPVKTRYLSADVVAEGLASDFEKIMEENDFRIRHEALKVLSSYGYEESQQEGFMERVNIDLRKRFGALLQKHRQGDSDLVTNLYFTKFVIQ